MYIPRPCIKKRIPFHSLYTIKFIAPSVNSLTSQDSGRGNMTPGISGNEPGETSETIKMTSLGFPEKWSVTIQKRSMIEHHGREKDKMEEERW